MHLKNNLLKTLKLGIFTCTLGICLSTTNVLASNTVDWPLNPPDGYPKDKVWTIDFSHDVDSDSISDDSIYILDDSDKLIPTKKILIADDLVEVHPVVNYSADSTYKLFIKDDVLSKAGTSLKAPIIMTFTIAPDEIIEDTFESTVQNALRTGIESLDISKYEIQKTELAEKVHAIVDSDPLILYYDGYKSSYSSSTGIVKTVTFKYKIDSSEINTKRETVKAKADEILESLNLNGKSDYEKVVAVHDYLVKNIIYDSEGFDNDTVEADQYSMYGALVENSAVCEGYAESFLYFMNQLDIDCKRVTGLGNGGSHAWNLVKVGGDWYHLDATFDDPVPDKGDYVTRFYLLTNDERMSQSHQWDTSNYPAATSLDFYYYRNENLEAKSETEFKSLVKSLYNSGTTTFEIWCSNFDSATYNLDLIRAALHDMGYYNSYRYNIREEHGIIYLEL